MLGNFLRKVCSAFVLLRTVGPRVFFEQLRRHIYSQHLQIIFEKNLEENNARARNECRINYSLRLATKEDMDEVFQKVKTESKEAVQMLLHRKWLYDCGFRNWYIARTTDTNELCFVQGIIQPEDNKLIDGDLRNWFQKLKEGEALLEGAYTFEKYRGNRLCDSVANDIFEIYRKLGFKRIITYVKSDNVASLRAAEKTGFKKFGELSVLKILFFTIRKKARTRLRTQLRSLAKKSQFIVGLYRWFLFLKDSSGTDLLNLVSDIGKTRLILTAKPQTMLSYPRLSTLYNLASRLERRMVMGSFVECGVRNGGSAAIIAAAAKRNLNRHVWLFDSWEGFPEPDKRDIAYDLEKAAKGGVSGSKEKVKELLFRRLNLDNARVHLVKGWFADTLPRSEVGAIALLHLDCDLYESTKVCLEKLYNNVVQGGCIVIDDYGYWNGCKEAVDEFIKQCNLKVKLVKVDFQAVYFHKES